MRPLVIAAFLLMLFPPTGLVPRRAAAETRPDFEEMASELARLRAEVEDLTEKLDVQKESESRELRALGTQRSALEGEVERESLRIKELEGEREKLRERVLKAGAFETDLKPAVLEGIEALEGVVRGGLPFRIEERMKDLETLRDEVSSNTLLPSTATTRLWSRFEDELKLGKENGLYSQVIHLAGQDVLADVARIGMVMMYFQTPDGRVGTVAKSGDEWRYRVYAAAEPREQVQNLFDALKKRARVGFFELPNPMAQENR